MAQVHPTALLEGNITLNDDVVVGPNCVLRGDITIGSGTELIGSSYFTGKLVMGERNIVYPFSSIGFAAQDINYAADQYEPGIVIGNDNTFREGCTVHRATQELPTTIGDHNVLMTTAHVGHDCQIGNHVTIVSNTCLGGHVHVHDNALLGGSSGAHQFVTIGKGAMIAAFVMTTYDILPYFMLTGINVVGSINVIGMRRTGMEPSEITSRKDIYKLLYRSKHSLGKAIELLRDRDDAIAMEYIEAIDTSRRGIVPLPSEHRAARRNMAVKAD